MVVTPVRVSELAEQLGLPLEGDGTRVIGGVASLEAAGPEDLAFVRSARFRSQAEGSAAGALVAPPGLDLGDRTVLRSPHPDLAFASATAWLMTPPPPKAGVHPSAVVEESAEIDPSASVGPLCSVGARVRIGAGSVLRARVALYDDVEVGRDCELHAGVVLRENTRVGDRVVIHPGAVLGADGFGYAQDEQGLPVKIPQVGTVVIEDDVEIGANTTIDRGALGETRVRRRAKIDNLCTVAHNCDIGEGVVIAALSGLSGSAVVGKGAFLMGQTGVADHVRIGERAFLAGRAGAERDVEGGQVLFGYPLLPRRVQRRAHLLIGRLPELLRRIRVLERRVLGGDADAGDEG